MSDCSKVGIPKSEDRILFCRLVSCKLIPSVKEAAPAFYFVDLSALKSNTKSIMKKDILAYHRSLSPADKTICDLLFKEINDNMQEAENKIWHKHPVWFINGNPIVGYCKLKDCIRLLFWSGQSFEESGLQPEGSFKAAEARYTTAEQINLKDLKRWLKKSKTIQWDYKNIVKRKGVLERLM